MGRIRNTLAYGLSKNHKLPKYIFLCLEDSLLSCIDFTKPGVSELYGRDINWLATEFKDMIEQRKKHLLPKAKKFLYPQLFWILLPHHGNFSDNQLRDKFNTCIEAVVAQYREMKILKLKKHWDGEELDLVDEESGTITNRGVWKYWMSIDEAVEFWENGKFKNKMYSVGSGREFISHLNEQHQRNQRKWHRTPDRRDRDRFRWWKEKQVFLPPPPKHK